MATHPRTRSRALVPARSLFLLTALVVLGAAACSNDTVVGISKQDAARLGGKDDQGRDYCQLLGWYGDGICDDFCPQPDPDCGTRCGPVTCAAGQVCCNDSCGICTEPGGVCTQQLCGAADGGPGPGGEPCGPTTCAPGQVCCNAGCGICTEPGGACTQEACAPVDGGPAPDGGQACGSVTCGPGEVCCNASCGICTPPGGVCTQQLCGEADGGAGGESCGPTTCAPGQVCCNESCGICTEPGGFCTQQVCKPTECPPVVCTLACENGFKRGPDGCEICACEDRTPASGQCIRNSNDACSSDADCVSGGCGGELCYNPASGGGASTCDCFEPQGVSCGCVNGQCTWYN